MRTHDRRVSGGSNENVESVPEWTGHICKMFQPRRRATSALYCLLPALTRVGCHDELEVRGISDLPAPPAHHDSGGLEGDAQRIEDVSGNLRHLVEKQHPVMRLAHRTGQRNPGTTTQQLHLGQRRVRRHKRPVLHNTAV